MFIKCKELKPNIDIREASKVHTFYKEKNYESKANLPHFKILPQDLGSRDPNVLWTLIIGFIGFYWFYHCIIKVKAEFMNKSKEYYNDNEDIAVMMFDINYGYRRCC